MRGVAKDAHGARRVILLEHRVAPEVGLKCAGYGFLNGLAIWQKQYGSAIGQMPDRQIIQGIDDPDGLPRSINIH